MNSSLVMLGMGIAIGVLLLVMSWRRRHQVADLGTVSHQWIAEQRLGHGHDVQR